MEGYLEPNRLEAGLDEAGMGPLIGPVYAACVYWDPEATHSLVRDSKKLSARQRLIAWDFIREEAIAFGIAKVDAPEIDQINIKQAGIRAMHCAVDATNVLPSHLIVDGNYFKFYLDKAGESVSHTCIVKGDSKYYSIAAASILAKVSHDREINAMCDKHPILEEYGLRHNMGYGTEEHMSAIASLGPTSFHRLTFRGCKEHTHMLKKLKPM
jgi:ribonuclease HII